ncbi:hypothetical protein MAXJ12_36266, partial [Mesorhizobium alhagi CCNWXJ12-2]
AQIESPLHLLPQRAFLQRFIQFTLAVGAVE